MTAKRFYLPVLISSFSVLLCGGAERKFPQWRGSNLELPAEWDASPIAAVGEITAITEYGEQTVRRLPWPMSPDVHRLFWCEGDFHVIAVVKGEIHGLKKKYLWGSAMPGCKLSYGTQQLFQRFQTRVWFLREEGDFLRPTFDGGTHGFLGLYFQWSRYPDLPPRERLGTLLLTPEANSDALGDYARYLWSIGDIACELLGKRECVRRFRALEELGDSSLKEAACGYLTGQQREPCYIPR
jgi:hypothetical protein